MKKFLFFTFMAFMAFTTHAWAQATTTNLSDMPEGSYKLDPTHTNILFKVSHMGFSEYVGRFNEMEGTINFSPDAIGESAVQININPASIDTNHEELEEKLRGEAAFDVVNFPRITFAASRIEWGADNSAIIEGNLFMLGETHPVTFDAEFNGGGVHPFSQRYTLGFQASTVIDRTDWGFDTWIPMVGNNVEIQIHAEFNSLQTAEQPVSGIGE